MNNKIKVIEIVGGLGTGGVESFLFNYLSHLDQNKYQISIVSHETPNPEVQKSFEDIGCTVYQVPPKRENLIKNLRALFHIFRKTQPDIVHCHLSLSNYAALIVAKLCGIKHRISHTHLFYSSKSFSQKIFCHLINRFATQRIACGETAANYLYGKHSSKVLRNAIKIEKYEWQPKVRKELRSNLGVNENTTLIGTVGRLRTQKNPLFLVEVFAEYHNKHPNSKLIFVGDGHRKNDVEAKIHALSLDNDVILAGERSDVEKYYQAFDVFVLPSNYEGLAIALIEAQASGLPCVVSTAIPVESKITNLVRFVDLKCEPTMWADNIADMISKHPTRSSHKAALSNAGYDIEESWKQLEDLYTKLVRN